MNYCTTMIKHKRNGVPHSRGGHGRRKGMGPLDSERVVGQLRELYRRYGYIQYKMSKFEPYDLYVQNKIGRASCRERV